MAVNDTTQAERELAHAITVPDDRKDEVIAQARRDALQLVADVRDLDPERVWGRLGYWLATDPERLAACCWWLAVLLDPDEPVNRRLAWVTRPRTEWGAAA